MPVEVSKQSDAAYVTIIRADQCNALSWALQHQLGTVLNKVAQMCDVRFIVLTGEGENFSSGGDLAEIGNAELPNGWLTDYWVRMRETILQLRSMTQVVIAGIRGVAVGAGASLAMAADIVVAEEDARLRFNFGHIGAVPDAGAAIAAGRSGGVAMARDLLLTGRWISANEAQSAGMISRVCPNGTLSRAIDDLLRELRKSPQSSLVLTKRIIDDALLPDLAAVVFRDGVFQRAVFPAPSVQTGVAANGASERLGGEAPDSVSDSAQIVSEMGL